MESSFLPSGFQTCLLALFSPQPLQPGTLHKYATMFHALAHYVLKNWVILKRCGWEHSLCFSVEKQARDSEKDKHRFALTYLRLLKVSTLQNWASDNGFLPLS